MKISYVWTWPFDVLVWLFWVLPFWALWGTQLRWEEGSLAFSLKEDAWPSRTWYKRWSGTALGHALMYSHKVKAYPRTGLPHRTVVHEQFHVSQYEAVMLGSFLVGLACFITLATQGMVLSGTYLGVAIWTSGYLQMVIPAWLAAVAAGGRAYYDSHHERAARAISFRYQRTGTRE